MHHVTFYLFNLNRYINIHKQSQQLYLTRADLLCSTAQSCTDLVNRGLRDNASVIEIDPDKGSKQKPFWVYCDVNSDNSTGVTVIRTYTHTVIRTYTVSWLAYVTSS